MSKTRLRICTAHCSRVPERVTLVLDLWTAIWPFPGEPVMLTIGLKSRQYQDGMAKDEQSTHRYG